MFTLEQLKVEEEQAAEWEISKTLPHDVTALGRVQQTKALFSAGRSEAMKRLPVEDLAASILA